MRCVIDYGFDLQRNTKGEAVMGMLSKLMAAGGRPDPTHGFWYGPANGRRVASGVAVNETLALNYSACWAASRLITETIATLPRVMYKQNGTRKDYASSHPTYRMFRSEPNIRQGGVNQMAQQMNFVLNWGNAYALKIFDNIGRVVELWPIHPSRVPKEKIRKNADGTLTYFVLNDKLPPTELEQYEMFHVPGVLSEDGFTGKGVIAHAAESIGVGLATEQFGASFFGNGGGPAIVMTHPKTLGAEAADNLRRSWHKRYSGPDKAN